MKKIIRYRLSISTKFPATHPRKGGETLFMDKIFSALGHEIFKIFIPKIHTIRANFELWQKRFEKINKGEAVLELYYWSGKPYNSKCVTICQLGKDDGIGLQRIIIPLMENLTAIKELAKNDGLSIDDFEAWFKNYDLSEPMVIIHFTKFRY